jgi:hypothetical protein
MPAKTKIQPLLKKNKRTLSRRDQKHLAPFYSSFTMPLVMAYFVNPATL